MTDMRCLKSTKRLGAQRVKSTNRLGVHRVKSTNRLGVQRVKRLYAEYFIVTVMLCHLCCPFSQGSFREVS